MNEETIWQALASNHQSALRQEKNWAEGRADAFQFALNCQGDPLRLQAEIKYYQRELSDPESTASHKPLAPKMSVRLHVEGYLLGLQDALKIILESDQRNGHSYQDALNKNSLSV